MGFAIFFALLTAIALPIHFYGFYLGFILPTIASIVGIFSVTVIETLLATLVNDEVNAQEAPEHPIGQQISKSEKSKVNTQLVLEERIPESNPLFTPLKNVKKSITVPPKADTAKANIADPLVALSALKSRTISSTI